MARGPAHHVALRLLQGLGVLFLRPFLLEIRVVKEELLIFDLIKIKNDLRGIYILPILWYFGHLFIAVGENPDKPGS